MKNLLYSIAILTTLILISSEAFAQGPGSPPATPIDGGLGILLAAGAAYGAKKLRDHRKRST